MITVAKPAKHYSFLELQHYATGKAADLLNTISKEHKERDFMEYFRNYFMGIAYMDTIQAWLSGNTNDLWKFMANKERTRELTKQYWR